MPEQYGELVSLRELSAELGLPSPEQAILEDALAHLVNNWPVPVGELRDALASALQQEDRDA